MSITGLRRNPFSKFSAEEELEILDEIFCVPKYYNELRQLLSEGNSRFVLGQRGQGKSMIIYKLFKDLSTNHTLPLLITRYDGIPITNNENHLLCRIIQALTFGIAKELYVDKKLRKRLSDSQKTKLSYFIEIFYDEHCSRQFIEESKEIKKIHSRNALARFYNRKVIGILNGIIDGTVTLTTDFIRRSLGMDSSIQSTEAHQYLGVASIRVIRRMELSELARLERSKLLEMVRFLVECSKSLEYRSIVILFDKIDEYPGVSDDIELVSNFALEILKDTDLLLADNIAIVFSLWSEIKRSLNRMGVRFDKFPEVDIKWRDAEMEPLMNHRLRYFSVNKDAPVTLKQLVPNDIDRRTVIELSNQSPRSMIRLLSHIYNEMSSIGGQISFSDEAIANGMVQYCKKFDYESMHPSKAGARKDLINWIERILRIKKPSFTVEDLNRTFGQRTNTSNKQMEDMVRLGLIKDSMMVENDNIIYDVVDNRLRHMMSRGIVSLE